jgi:hypothetical protein
MLGWDDDCPGLVGTLAREAEWRIREAHNNAVAASWGVDSSDGWGNTLPISPIQEESGDWPSQEALVDAEVAAWPHFPLDTLAIKMTVNTRSSIGDLVEEHPTCRSTAFIDCFSVLDLLSFLYHSAISTSVRSCVPRSSCE